VRISREIEGETQSERKRWKLQTHERHQTHLPRLMTIDMFEDEVFSRRVSSNRRFFERVSTTRRPITLFHFCRDHHHDFISEDHFVDHESRITGISLSCDPSNTSKREQQDSSKER
jgi:fermentation-respiration switch protein FrsA (DUF1100 family)